MIPHNTLPERRTERNDAIVEVSVEIFKRLTNGSQPGLVSPLNTHGNWPVSNLLQNYTTPSFLLLGLLVNPAYFNYVSRGAETVSSQVFMCVTT